MANLVLVIVGGSGMLLVLLLVPVAGTGRVWRVATVLLLLLLLLLLGTVTRREKLELAGRIAKDRSYG